MIQSYKIEWVIEWKHDVGARLSTDWGLTFEVVAHESRWHPYNDPDNRYRIKVLSTDDDVMYRAGVDPDEYPVGSFRWFPDFVVDEECEVL